MPSNGNATGLEDHRRSGLGSEALLNLLIKLVAIVCLIIGSITLLTPIPTGMLLIGVSIALLVPTSPTAQSWVGKLRRRHKFLDRHLHDIEPRLPTPLRTALAKTRG